MSRFFKGSNKWQGGDRGELDLDTSERVEKVELAGGAHGDEPSMDRPNAEAAADGGLREGDGVNS